MKLIFSANPHTIHKVLAVAFHTARAAQTGVACARLASKGFTGARKILEGERGFFATLCGDPHPEAVAADPKATWKIHEVGFKPWPACGSVRAPIGAALELRPQLDRNDILKIEVRTFEEALRFCNNPSPKTTKQARFSLQHAVAVALSEGSPTLESFLPSAINNPRVARIRSVVEVNALEEFSSAYPQRRGAEVEVELRGGEKFRSVVRDAPGDPPNSLDQQAIENKARMLLAAGGLSAAEADRIIGRVGALTHGGTLSEVTHVLPMSVTELSS